MTGPRPSSATEEELGQLEIDERVMASILASLGGVAIGTLLMDANRDLGIAIVSASAALGINEALASAAIGLTRGEGSTVTAAGSMVAAPIVEGGGMVSAGVNAANMMRKVV